MGTFGGRGSGEKGKGSVGRLSGLKGIWGSREPTAHGTAKVVNPGVSRVFIAEAVEPFSYLKSPFYRPLGYPAGIYRVGPLARLNLADRCGTPRADRELAEFRKLQNGPVRSSFHYHYARLIEILYSLERIEQLLNEPDILSPHVRASGGPNAHEGVGVSEAPRGTLIYHHPGGGDGRVCWGGPEFPPRPPQHRTAQGGWGGRLFLISFSLPHAARGSPRGGGSN